MYKVYGFCGTDVLVVNTSLNRAYFANVNTIPATIGELKKEHVKRITARTLQAVVADRQKGICGKVYYDILDHAYYDSTGADYLGEFSSWERVKKFFDGIKEYRFDVGRVCKFMEYGVESQRAETERHRSFIGNERAERELLELDRIAEFVQSIDYGFIAEAISGAESGVA